MSFLENFGAEQLGPIVYKTGSNRCRKVEETLENKSDNFPAVTPTTREVMT